MAGHHPYDVTIVGGGPAGAATALGLKRRDPRLRVALVEKTGYAARRVGETLPPPTERLLRDLGVWEAFVARAPLESFGSRAAWGQAGFHEREFLTSPYGRGWHVDRRAFDAMLVDQAERGGVEVFRKTRYRPGADGDRFAASVLVDATGRQSAIARNGGARHIAVDALLGVVQFRRPYSVGAASLGPAASSLDSYTTVEACEDGWWYSAALPGGDVAVVFMTDAPLLRRLAWRAQEDVRRLASVAPFAAAIVERSAPLGSPTVHPACSQRLDVCAGDGWLAAGDAASTFDPLSSQGVIKALRAGITASLAVCQHLAGVPGAFEQYRARVAREFDHYLSRRTEYYAMERRWPGSPFWRRRHEARPRIEGGETVDAVHLANQHHQEPVAAQAGDVRA